MRLHGRGGHEACRKESRILCAILLLVFAFAFHGCGQRGALVLPQAQGKQTAVKTTPASRPSRQTPERDPSVKPSQSKRTHGDGDAGT